MNAQYTLTSIFYIFSSHLCWITVHHHISSQPYSFNVQFTFRESLWSKHTIIFIRVCECGCRRLGYHFSASSRSYDLVSLYPFHSWLHQHEGWITAHFVIYSFKLFPPNYYVFFALCSVDWLLVQVPCNSIYVPSMLYLF